MAKVNVKAVMQELEQASQLLDAGGAPSAASLSQRLIAVAQKWLGRAAHSEGCQCAQCMAARKLLQKAHALNLLPTPQSFVVMPTPKAAAATIVPPVPTGAASSLQKKTPAAK